MGNEKLQDITGYSGYYRENETESIWQFAIQQMCPLHASMEKESQNCGDDV